MNYKSLLIDKSMTIKDTIKALDKGAKKVVIVTHKRAILGYLLKYLETGFNLDDRLILSFNDKVIVDDIEKAA